MADLDPAMLAKVSAINGMEHALTTHRRILATWSAFLPWLQERDLIAGGNAPYLEQVVELPPSKEPARAATRSSPDPIADIISSGTRSRGCVAGA